MGSASSRPKFSHPQDPTSYTNIDLPKFIFRKKIGDGKFLKTYSMQAMQADGIKRIRCSYLWSFNLFFILPYLGIGIPMVVKVFMSFPEDENNVEIHSKRLTELWRLISPVKYPNLLPYQCWIKSSGLQNSIFCDLIFCGQWIVYTYISIASSLYALLLVFFLSWI